jgi:hypothetical protein
VAVVLRARRQRAREAAQLAAEPAAPVMTPEPLRAVDLAA